MSEKRELRREKRKRKYDKKGGGKKRGENMKILILEKLQGSWKSNETQWAGWSLSCTLEALFTFGKVLSTWAI